MHLAWSDNSDNESGFEIEVSEAGGPFTNVTTVPADTTTYDHGGLTSDTEYCYQVRAVNVNGPSGYTAVECDTTPVVIPADPLPILEGDSWNYFKGQSEPPANWPDLAFDDSSWLSGPSGFGYGDGDDATVLSDMQGSYASVYLRKKFYVDDPSAIVGLTLTVDYDDGYVAYLNGVEVARSSNLSGTPPAFNKLASSDHEASGGSPPGSADLIDLTASIGDLIAGNNMLAVQAHNATLGSSDFSIIPTLVALDDSLPDDPTGLSANAVSSSAIDLAWNDNSDNESGFEIEVSEAGGPFALVTTAPADSMSYTHTGLTSEVEYCYQVRAVNVNGPSAYTNTDCATPPVAIPGDPLPIVPGTSWSYFKGQVEPPSDWNDLSFDDSAWLEGPSGFGYGDGDDTTVLSDMLCSYASVYLRKIFNVSDPSTLVSLTLTVDYDDAFVAYINGVEVARSSNISGTPPAFNKLANSDHEATGGSPPGSADLIDLTSVIPSLLTGDNVLAIQGHNATLGSSDFSLIPSLESVDSTIPDDPTALSVSATSSSSTSLV
jgi:hypothetical protein